MRDRSRGGWASQQEAPRWGGSEQVGRSGLAVLRHTLQRCGRVGAAAVPLDGEAAAARLTGQLDLDPVDHVGKSLLERLHVLRVQESATQALEVQPCGTRLSVYSEPDN